MTISKPLPFHPSLTPQIDLQSEDLFEVLALCAELGLPVLKSFCVDQLRDTLTVDSVCASLSGAHSKLGKSTEGDGTLKEIVQTCLKFIDANSDAVLWSDGFFELPRTVLISVVSSMEVCARVCACVCVYVCAYMRVCVCACVCVCVCVQGLGLTLDSGGPWWSDLDLGFPDFGQAIQLPITTPHWCTLPEGTGPWFGGWLGGVCGSNVQVISIVWVGMTTPWVRINY